MGVGEECSVDDVEESAFECSEGFFVGVAVDGSPVKETARWGVVAGLSEGGAVPLWRAYACREWNRSMPAVSPMGRGPPRRILGSTSGAVARQDRI